MVDEARLKDAEYVHTAILRGEIALTKAQAIHIAGLPADVEDRLERLRWRKITPESLPKAGEIVVGMNTIWQILDAFPVDEDWTIFRPDLCTWYAIAPPKEEA